MCYLPNQTRVFIGNTDVLAAVNIARQYNLTIAASGGRHWVVRSLQDLPERDNLPQLFACSGIAAPSYATTAASTRFTIGDCL